jgi:hypothetical protein
MIRKLRVAALAMPLLLVGCLYPYFPTADAGADQTVTEGAVVHLKGKGTDVDGKIKDYKWTQVAGPSVKLNGTKSKNLNFKAPDVDLQTTLEPVEAAVSPEEFAAYKRGIAKVIAAFDSGVIDLVAREYPDLKPSDDDTEPPEAADPRASHN